VDQVEVHGLRIAYQRRGEGPPLVLVHGWPADSRQWHRQIDALSSEFTVVAWDAPGAGRSSDPPEAFRLSDWADCLAVFIDALRLAQPHVVGLSFDGGLALELYRRHPSVPRTLILASAYAGWAGSLPAKVVNDRLGLMLRNCDLPPDLWAPGLIRTLLTDQAPADLVDELMSIISAFHPAATREAMRTFAEADLRDVLSTIDVPTLLLYGDADERTGPSVWDPLHSSIRDSKLVLIPGAGHVIDIQAPERFNAEVLEFLRQVGSG
jgi:pimeloyl-ACP methyl ester carboxylesterase